MTHHATLDDLLELAPSPDQPVEPGSSEQWKEVERTLGTPLPGDYKQMINAYGTGEFCDLFYLFNPFSTSAGMNLIWQAGVPDSLENDDELGRVYPLGSHLEQFQQLMILGNALRDCPFSTFPEPGGLLPVGGTTNGDYAFWLTKGPPEEWPLIFYDPGSPFERHSMPLVEFLVLWLSGKLPDCFFGSGDSSNIIRRDPVFCPSGQIRPPRPEEDDLSSGGLW